MSQFAFTSGERIRLNNELFHLRRKMEGSKWQLEKDVDGQYVIMEEAELRSLYLRNLMSFVSTYMQNPVEDDVVESKIKKTFGDYPEKRQQEAKQRLKYVKSIEGLTGGDIKEALVKTAKEVGSAAPPDTSTVNCWAKKFLNSGGDVCSLISNFSKRGNRKPRFPEEVVEIAVSKIREIYLSKNRGSEKETVSAIMNAVEVENRRRSEQDKLPKPQRKFVRNLINSIDAYEVMLARDGKKAADVYFREAITSGEIIKEPLERIEIDHTILDLMVVDSNTCLPLGRPTLTIAIDRCTRCICGYHLGFDPPSYVSCVFR